MARRKRSTVKRSRRGSTARHGRRRSATAGKVLPPIEVKSSADLPSLKRIFENSAKHNHVILVAFVSLSCGHCIEYMKHWKEAVRSPHRSVEAVQVQDHMVDEFNEFIHKNVNQRNSPVEIEAVPTVKMMNNNGEVITDIEPVKNTKTLSQVMNESSALANQAGLLSPTDSVNGFSMNEMHSPPIPSVASPPSASSASSASFKPNNSLLSNHTNQRSLSMSGMNNTIPMNNIPPSTSALSATTMNANSFSNTNETQMMEPSDLSEDLLTNSLSLPPNEKLRGGSRRGGSRRGGSRRGGSLYGALASTAYTLAPAATLLGIASVTIKRRRHHRSSKGRKRSYA